MKKSIVLLSGGLDSTVNFYQAVKETKVLLALTFDYGQRAAPREIQAAQYFAGKFGIQHQVIKLPFFSDWNQSSLINRGQEVPAGISVQIDNLAKSFETAKAVWVPNRNGIFLNIAAGFAEARGADWIIPGFNKEEAATFPDNSLDFLSAMDRSLEFSTANHVKTHCFTINENKTQIVQRGKLLGVEFTKLWFCYLDGEKWCGQCESCQRGLRALGQN